MRGGSGAPSVDHTTVVLNSSKRPTAAGGAGGGPVNRPVIPPKKSNAASTSDGQKMASLDRADDVVKVKTIDRRVSQTIIKSRNEKGYNQDELARRSNVDLPTLKQYENGSATMDPKIIARLERVLGVFLTGSKIGEEKFKKKTDKK